jgi:hypothetical protein
MDADEHGFFRIDHAASECKVVTGIGGNAVEMAVEIAVVRGHEDGLLTHYQFLGTHAVLDELGDGAGLELVFFLIAAELADARHRAIVIHNFTNHGGARKLREQGEIERGLSVSCTPQHTIGHGLQWEDVAWLHEGIRPSIGIC